MIAAVSALRTFGERVVGIALQIVSKCIFSFGVKPDSGPTTNPSELSFEEL